MRMLAVGLRLTLLVSVTLFGGSSLALDDPWIEAAAGTRSHPFAGGVPVQTTASQTIGFLGCSMTLNAVDGYYAQGGRTLWPTATTTYGGGSIGAWAANLSDQSRYWGAFSRTLASRATTTFWFELCTSLNQTPALDTYAGAEQVIQELRRRVPAAVVYVSAQPSYTNGHVCGIAGASGPATAQSISDQLVANGIALRGPVMGPLSSAQTVDGCHATTEAQAMMGNQLKAAFDTAAPPPDTSGNHSFVGPITGKTIPFRVYLPASYSEEPTRRYPVIYHLHGAGANYTSGTDLLETAFGASMANGTLPEAIIVFPDGNIDSFWANSHDNSVLVETHVIRELIPYVDATYRTIADRGSRAIQGFSMGGFGAMEYAVKFPLLFGTVVSLDGALLLWNDLLYYQPAIALEMFNNSELYFNDYSPYSNAKVNQATIRALGTNIFVLVGQLKTDNQNWTNQLDALNIPYELHDSACQHSFRCITGNAIDMDVLAAFLRAGFASTLADNTAPSIPAALTASPVSSSRIDLSWSASHDPSDSSGTAASGVVGYGVYRNGTLIANASGTTYADTGLSAATTYVYTVRALDAAGNSSAPSASASAATQSATGSTKFTLGQRVQTTASFSVHATAGGTILGTQATGSIGTILGGPVSSGGDKWWQLNFNSGVDGWGVEDALVAHVTPGPAAGATWPDYFSTSRDVLPVWASTLRRTATVDSVATLVRNSDVVLTLGVQVCGALGSGRDQAQVNAHVAGVTADGGTAYRNCIRSEAIKGVQAQTDGHVIYWHIGNEINSKHYSATMGTTGRSSDPSMISNFVEYFVAPTVQALDEAGAQTGFDTPAVLGSIVSGHNPESRAWLDSILNYTILGAYAPALAGKKVYEVVDYISLHYTIAADNWEESFNDVSKWIGQGKVRGVVDTEELGSQSIARGAAGFQALQGFANFMHWVNARGYTPEQGRLNFWAQGDDAPDEAMTILHTFLGDTALASLADPALVSRAGSPSAHSLVTVRGDKRLITVVVPSNQTASWSAIQFAADGWSRTVSGTMYVSKTDSGADRVTVEPVIATLSNGVYTISRSTSLASESAVLVFLEESASGRRRAVRTP